MSCDGFSATQKLHCNRSQCLPIYAWLRDLVHGLWPLAGLLVARGA